MEHSALLGISVDMIVMNFPQVKTMRSWQCIGPTSTPEEPVVLVTVRAEIQTCYREQAVILKEHFQL